MLLPVPMKKIMAVVHRSRKDDILKELKEKGTVEIRDASDSDILEKMSLDRGKSSWVRIEASENISKIDGIIDVLSQASEDSQRITSLGKYKELIRGIPSNHKEISIAFEEIAERLFLIEDKVTNLNNNLNSIRKEIEEFEGYKNIVKRLEKFNIGPKNLRGLMKTHAFFGNVPKDDLPAVEEELNVKLPAYVLENMELDKKIDIIILITYSEYEAEVTRILRTHHFEEIEIPLKIIPYTLGETKVKIDENLKELKEEEENILDELKEIASKEMENLLRYREFLSAARKLDEVNRKFASTRDTYIFQGWVPRSKAEDIKELIEELSEGECIVEINEPEKGDTPPTLINNPKITKPLEVITTNYGYPSYNELDPSSIIGLTFPIIFGFMFGDIGEGVIVALIGYMLGFRLKVGKNARKLGRTLILCGISATIVGFLYGSLFGLEGRSMKHYLGFELKPLWMSINPISTSSITAINIQNAVLFSLEFGVLLISLALVLNVIKLSLQKEYKYAFVHPSGVAGLWFFLGSVVLLFHYGLNLMSIIASQLSLVLFYLPLVVIIIGEWKVRGQSLGMSLFDSVFDVVLRYLSNGLSFVRIMIMGIIHAAFAGMMVMGMGGVSNPILISIIFIFGNIGIIIMETFMSFIQDLRLHFYEIFSKFYAGNGVQFNPLKISFKFLEK